MSKVIKLQSDKVKISGPRVDGSFTVTLEVGEYEKPNIAKLLFLPNDEVISVSVEVEK